MSRIGSGELGTQAISEPLGETCQKLQEAQDHIIAAASDAGLTDDSFVLLEVGIQDILSDIYD